MKRKPILLICLFLITFLSVDCSTTKKTNKKCDNTKGVKTPMGVM